MPGVKSRRKPGSAKPRNAQPSLRPRKPGEADLAEYSEAQIAKLVNLPATLIDSLRGSGQIHPTPSSNGLRFSFEDSLVLRVAGALRESHIPANRVADVLIKIREALPPGMGLAALRPGPPGPLAEPVPLAQASLSVPVDLPLVIHARVADASAVKRREADEKRRSEAEQHFERAVALEESDMEAARAGYLAALKAHSGHLEARINLGRLLHLSGELDQAEKIYRKARHSSALLSFNLAILLEDLNREEEAITAYREALALDPSLHDAHYNLSRLHERAESPRDALRHLLAYHRHIRNKSNS